MAKYIIRFKASAEKELNLGAAPTISTISR